MSDDHAPLLVPFQAETGRFAAGTSTPRAFLEACIERIDALEPRLGAFAALDLDAARLAADAASARWREGRPLSPVDGMPFGVKDVIETADLPTGMGSPLFDGYRARFDAAAVSALRGLGAVLVGKTVTTEFASLEPAGTRNPWDLRRTPGGSSSGSAAAVGAGMLPAALGTQVLGSVIRPAGFCGAYGFKPSFGAINRGGSLDYLSQSCLGVLAGSLGDAWVTARQIARVVGGDPGHAALAGPEGLPPVVRPQVLGLLETPGWEGAEPAARAALEEVLAALPPAGVRVVRRRGLAELGALEAELGEAEALSHEVNAWEWRWPLNVFAARDLAAMSGTARARLALANRLTEAQYTARLRRREAMRALHARLLGSVDALVTLSAPGPAPVGLGSTGNPIFALPASVLGAPAVTLPMLSVGGMPVGLQLVGFAGRDAALLSLARFVLGER